MISKGSSWEAMRLTYGITPPKVSTPLEKRREVAAVQSARISALPIDALVVYDLQDESSRTDALRPFPFLESIDPLDYAFDDLADVPQKKVVYRSVSGLDTERLSVWLRQLEARGGAAVLVGAPSTRQVVNIGLGDAYRLRSKLVPKLPLGGVTIAERHETRGGEEERILRKIEKGCSFFISQAVYSVTASKGLLSDLYYRCQVLGEPSPLVLVTLSPCGSKKTLEFMHWLGISVPRWLQNELLHAHDILEKSVDHSIAGFEDLYDFAREKGIRLGCNIESVSLRKAEIDASVEMLQRVAKLMNRKNSGI